ncbi:MAG: ABC transporter permease [Sulfuricella sp.]|nr:ABC transporter permease [Sulfuricella sp.]
MTNPLKTLHQAVVRKSLSISSVAELAWGALCRTPALGRGAVRRVLLKQLYFTGMESVGAVGAVAFLVGLIIVTQMTNLVGRNETLTVHVLIWVIVRELGPLLTAVVIIGRSSSAVASELAAMQVNGEIKSLRRMAISPLSYLVMPRMLGMTLSSVALTFYFQAVAIAAGVVTAALRQELSLGSEIAEFFEVIDFADIAASFLKSAVFGVLVAVVSCYHGLRVKTAWTEIPQAASQAVIRSLLAVFVWDGLITVLVF